VCKQWFMPECKGCDRRDDEERQNACIFDRDIFILRGIAQLSGT
jgi:hypothetical protein